MKVSYIFYALALQVASVLAVPAEEGSLFSMEPF